MKSLINSFIMMALVLLVSSSLVRMALVIMLLSIGATISYGQFIKGLKPVQSTCHDVERLFGGEHCGKKHEEFKYKTEKISITYAMNKCEQLFGKRWDLPRGTIVRLERFFLDSIEIEKLGIGFVESEYEKRSSDIVNHAFYDKKSGDIFLSILNGRFVDRIEYFPSSADEEKFLCEDDSSGNLSGL